MKKKEAVKLIEREFQFALEQWRIAQEQNYETCCWQTKVMCLSWILQLLTDKNFNTGIKEEEEPV
jgi:hypothetical protein